MLTYNFTNIGSDSMYEYLYKCIKNDILQGTLQAGEKLPSKRSFAKNLGISVITVENAYEQLIAEGYIYSMPKRGFYVTDFKGVLETKQREEVQEIIPMTSGENSYLADFTSNQTEADQFPFTIWAKMVREVLSDSRIQLMTNPPCGGIMSLRQSIAGYLKDFRGMTVQPEQIIIGAGTEYLYGLLIQLLGHEAVYAVENPGYQKIGKIYRNYQVNWTYIDMDDEGVEVSQLEEKKVDIVHISPSHHYPTGIVMPISRRYELLGWASKGEGRYIIEDDYDSELRLGGKPIPTLQSIDISEKVIYMNTFTKSLAPTIRISYMVLPLPLMEQFNRRLGFYSCTVSNFEQYTLARFIREGHFEKHINRMRIYYRNQRDFLISAIKKSPLDALVTIQEKDAGLHFLMKVDTSMSDEQLTQKAKEAGLKITCLSQYYFDRDIAVNHTLVINYSALKTDTIAKAVELLYKCLI